MDHHCRQSDSSDDSGKSDNSSDLPPFFNCDRNRPEEMRSSHDAKLLKPGSPAIYYLNTERKYINGIDRKVRQWTYGRRDRNKQNKVILIVGETGAGKTTMINTMINYLLGVKFEDQEFYQITDEEEHKDQTQSQTSAVTVYEVFVEKNPTSLTIIDTPGYGDTEGYEKDREISEYLMRLFSDEDGIHYIDAVCFVMKASQNRLTGKELYIFHSILSLFGRDIENNIVFLLTHSDGLPPTDALNAIKKAQIPCRRDEDNEPVYFPFNNQQKTKRDKRFKRALKASWEMGEESMTDFLTLLEEKNRKSVNMTLDVLKERRRCHYSDHIKEGKKYVMKSKDVIMTFDDLKKQYECSSDQKITKFDEHKYEEHKKELEVNKKESEKQTTMREKLSSDVEKITNEKSKLLHEAYVTIISLSKIALKSDSALTLRHLDFLIQRLKEEGKDEWIKNLEDLKKTGEEQKNKGALEQMFCFFQSFGKKILQQK